MAAEALADMRAVFARYPESRDALLAELGEQDLRTIEAAAEVLRRAADRLDSGPASG